MAKVYSSDIYQLLFKQGFILSRRYILFTSLFMPKHSHPVYFYGAYLHRPPSGIGPSLIMAAATGEFIGHLFTLPFKTPFYVAAFVKQLRSHPIVKKEILALGLSQKEQEERIRKGLYRLRHRKLITYQRKKNKTIELHLTAKGMRYYKKLKLRTLRIPVPVRWDGKWHMILFDIPEKNRLLRDVFRNRLRQLGFFRIQKSVWVHPFECEAEVRFLAQEYNLQRHILLYTITIENDEGLRKHFRLIK